jgi:hypothetical protein
MAFLFVFPTIYSMLLKEEYRKLINSLLPYAQKKLGFEEAPKINFRDDHDNSANPLGKTGYYEPKTKEITVFVTNRHPKDILRSVSHELVHYQQDCDGRLTSNMRNDLYNKNYAQTNPKLREFEEEAYLYGNMIFRDWEDNYKNKARNTNNIRINKMNESNLRAMIKSAIAEVVAEAKKTKKKEEEQRTDVSKVRDSAKKFLKNKKIMSEETESESMTLSEWKNDELFGLLTERFGIVKEMSEKDKKLAAMYPPKDKITRGDVITAAKKKAENGDSEEEEEEELDEAKDLPKKVLKKGHKIGKSIKKSNSDVDNPFAVGMAAAKKEAGIK